MGVVFKQSLNNTIVTYIGFGIGAVNVLFLYTNFMSEEYYGLVNVVLSASTVLMPILAFGVPNTLVKFYSSFKDKSTADGFLTLMLLLPLALMLPLAAITYVAHEAIGAFISQENEIVKDYVWPIFLIGMAMAYFEVFYAWARVKMKSVFGNFMKEVFSRTAVTLLLFLLYFDFIAIQMFIPAAVGVYALRTLIMCTYAFSVRKPVLSMRFPANTGNILVYTTLIITGGSAAIVLLEIDKVMINQFIEIENVAYYSVAGFIAMVIAVPSRAMHQITYPLTAELLNKNDRESLGELYHRSSLTLFIVSGLLFVLILTNLDDLYEMLPEAYRNGFVIFVWLGLAKVFDALLGNNNSILYNSDYYRAVLMMGVLLAVLTVCLNLWLIPKFGLDGAAIASFSAFFVYNVIKIGYVKSKFALLPFTRETLKVAGLLMALAIPIYYLEIPFHPIVKIIIKGTVVSAVYITVLYRFRISSDVFGVMSRFLNPK